MSANGRWQQRRNRCSTGSPAERRHPNVPETRAVARTVRERREGIPSHFGSRPANAYLEGQTLTRSVKRVARGLRNVEYLATAIFPGLGGYRSTPSLALHPSPCYPPETPKSRNSELFRGSCGLTPWRRCRPGSGATRAESVFPTKREGLARRRRRHAVATEALVPSGAARGAIRIATRVATVYTNAPKRHRETILADLCTLLRPHVCPQQRNSPTVYTNAPKRRGEARSSHLCTLLRPHVCPQQRNSVHKCPKTAPRGHSSQFVYTLALSPACATRCHRVAGRSCTRRHRVARKSVYAQLSGNVVPLDAIEWHDHRALGDSEWHNRASQNRRQPERLVVAPWLTGGGVRSAGGSGASA